MKKVLCRVVSFILMMTMVMSMAISVGAAKPEDFNDFPSESYWATPALKSALANNILYGKENGNIDSKSNLTRAEMAAIISRAFGAVVKSDISGFKDLDPAQWYYSEFAKAVRMGVFSGDENGNMNPDSPITREEAFTVFARAMALSDDDTSVLSKFGDASDISGWAKEYLAPLVKKGYVNGNEANNLLPKSNITREEFAQFMHNMFKTYYSNQGTYKEVGTDSAIINTTDVNLTGITVEDDLVIGDGADLSTITLTNVVIKGRLLVRGGATVRLVNVTVAEGVVVNNVNATVHFDNYASELVFTGINMNTPATFKENYSISSGGSNTGGGTSTPTYPYYVKYYEQNIAQDDYVLVRTDTFSGKSGTNVSVSVPRKTGFTYNAANSTTSGSVVGSPYLVLEVYYDRNTYTVSFDADGGTPAPTDQFIPYQGTIALPAVTKAGYAFAGWYNGTERIESTTQVTSAMNLTAHWTLLPPTDAQYTVYYYQQKVDLTGYEEVIADRVVTTGRIGEAVTAPSKTYTGFTQNTTLSTTSGIVMADGSLELKVYFDRNIYTVSFDADGGTPAPTDQFIPYQGTIALPAVTKTGYAFAGWYNGTERIESTTQVTSAMNLTAHWTLLPPTTAQYTVYYYQQKVDLTGYEEVIADRVVTTGRIGEVVTAPSKTYTGFTQNTTLSTTSGIVMADGSLELKVYFDRNIYTVSFDADGGTPAPTDQFIPYQGTIALPTVTKSGYAFAGWYNGTERIESTTQVTSAMSLKAHWTLLPPTTAQYTVYYYQQKVDLSGYEEVTADRVVTTGTIGEIVTAPSKTYTGFEMNTTLSTTSGIVVANGSLELKVYFDRITYTVTFKEGTSVLGQEIVAANTTLNASRIPSTTRKYTGFTKDGSISSVYVSSPKTYEIAFNWWYNPEIGKWEQFTDETVVKGNMTVYSTSQRVNLNLYVDKLGRSLTFGTYYAPDTRLADAINDVLSQGASLRAVKDTGFYDKALEKLKEYNLIDDSGNILMQEILVKFSKIIGETNLEEYIVDNAKAMFTTSDRLRNSIIDYIRLKASSSNPSDVTEIKEFIERIIAYSINNTATGMTEAETMFRDMMENDDTFFKDVTGYEPSSLIPARKELIINQTIVEFETNTVVQAQAINKVASYIIKPAHISRIDDYVDHALAYLNSDTTLRDQVVDDIIEKMYRDTLDTLLYEVINERQFEVNIDNVFVAEGLKSKVEEFNFDEIKNQIPDKFFAVYPESKLREIFEDASSRILAQINAALADADLGIASYVDTGYTFIINPVSDIYTPLYERAIEIIRDKNVYYNENIYLKELLTLFETNSLFDGSENAKPNALSGYSLKTIDDYYDIVKKSAILGDDAIVWYNENLNVDRINEVIDNYESIVLKYVNLAADILDNYANTGEIPDRLDNKFVNAFENAVKQKFPSLVNRLVEWYKTSPINKDYTGDDYAKIKKGINFAFNNVNITVNEVFDDILARKFSQYQTANDTYSKEFKGNKVTFYREIQR